MSFEFQIELSRKDYFKFFVFDFYTNLHRLLWLALVWVVCAVFVTIVLGTFGLLLIIIFPTGLVLLVSVIFKLLSWLDSANKAIKEKNNKYKLTFNEETFFIEDRIKKGEELKASTFLRIIDTEKYLFLYITDNTAFIVPKKQLTDNLYDEVINFFNKNNIPIKKHSF